MLDEGICHPVSFIEKEVSVHSVHIWTVSGSLSLCNR